MSGGYVPRQELCDAVDGVFGDVGEKALLQSFYVWVKMGCTRADLGMSEFKWRQFEGEIILWAVRWYCRYGISYRDLEQMMGERGVSVDHSTIYRWVQKYAPEIEKRLRWQWRRPQSTSWRVDETYVKVRGKWAYLYRALDKHGNTIDFYLSPTRTSKAAKRFLGKALNGLKAWEKPEIINTDKAPTCGIVISALKAEGKCPEDTVHRQVKYLNNVIEADHGKLKQLIRPVRGFKTLKTAYATIAGFEVMRALRKGQAAIFNLTRDIRGEARIVERAFGLGPSALTETIALIGKTLNLQSALSQGNENDAGSLRPHQKFATEPDKVQSYTYRCGFFSGRVSSSVVTSSVPAKSSPNNCPAPLSVTHGGVADPAKRFGW